MPTTTTNSEQRTANRAAAVRHAVYRDLLGFLPVASYDQALQFAANLRLRAVTPAQKSAALFRFLGLRVTPDIAETAYRGASQKEIELWVNRKYGEHLQHVPGLYRLGDASPFRFNMPFKCVLYGYRSPTRFLQGILCQPIDRLNSYFLLSSAKFGGPKAVKLTPADEQYFTQFEEVTV